MAPGKEEKGAGKPIHRGGPGLVPWIYDTYMENLRLADVEGGRRYHAFLSGARRDFSSVLKRAQAFHIVKFGYPLRRAGYEVAVFAARAYTTGTRSRRTETYYAYAYWPREGGGEAPEYICLGATYDSRDGEYRHRFLWYPDFRAGYESLNEALAPYEEALLAAIAADELVLDVSLYPDTSDRPRSYLESSRLGVMAFAAALALDAPRVATGRLDAHATPAYVSVVKAVIALAPGTFGGDSPRWLTAEGGRFFVFETGVEGEAYRPQCGQKLVPLTVREALQVGDVNFSPWREAWVGGRASDLVINGVAPGFSLYGSWTYLSGARMDLFENPPMRGKYTRSLLVEGVTRSLREARRATASDAASYRLGQLDARVYSAILYAQDYLTLTDLVLCTVGEYIGRTIATRGRDVATLIRRGIPFSPGWRRMYEDPAMATRYIFDFCYGAHVLHTRAGALHSDLHLNNMTIFENRQLFEADLRGEKTKYRAVAPGARIAYVAGKGGESETYVFPHDGWFGCLIDFSRSLLGPAAREDLVAEQGESFAAKYYLAQNCRTLRVLEAYAPHFVKTHQARLRELLLAAPDQVFRAMTAVDFLAIGHNYGAFLRELAGEGDLAVCPEAIACAEAVEKHALQHLITYLTDLVATSSDAPCGTVPYAGEGLLPVAFGSYLYSRRGAEELRDADLADVFVATAPLSYSGSAYDKFPPWANLEALSEHLGGHPLALVTAERGERPFLSAQGFDSYLAVLQEAVRRRYADRPAPPNSSWLSTPGS